ncbi:MAG TPA: cytochrome c oxidase assembly factor CtaG [Jeotgalicoccus sp.]|nr:cytochrome c oxidase assembly factor CtaG [Jeotgalicoccus sp.]
MDRLLSIRIFGFIANWSPFLLVFTIAVAIAYFLLTMKWYKEFEGGRKLTPFEIFMSLSVFILFYITFGSPIDILSHILFTFHMIQMALGLLLIPPMLYFAVPDYLWRYLVKQPVLRQLHKMCQKPLVVLVLFCASFSLYHIPVVMDALKMNQSLHVLALAILFITATMCFWPVLNTIDPQEKHMGGLFKMLYVFGIGGLLLPACGLIIFAEEPMFKTYTESGSWLKAMELCVPAGVLDSLKGQNMISGPEYFSTMTPLGDQRTGGIIMKILQEVFFSVILGYIFFHWWKSESGDQEEITRKNLEKVLKQQELDRQYR